MAVETPRPSPEPTVEPQPAGPPPGDFEARESGGVRYLVSYGGAGDAVAHEVVASVGEDGCLYLETTGPNPGPETETWLAVLGDPGIEVTETGLLIGSESVPFGTTFSAGATATPPIDELPADYAAQCTGADQAWSIASS